MKMPFKTVVTYAQVVGQLGRVLHVPYPSVSKGVMNIFQCGSIIKSYYRMI
jgi:hypothetical protein